NGWRASWSSCRRPRWMSSFRIDPERTPARSASKGRPCSRCGLSKRTPALRRRFSALAHSGCSQPRQRRPVGDGAGRRDRGRRGLPPLTGRGAGVVLLLELAQDVLQRLVQHLVLLLLQVRLERRRARFAHHVALAPVLVIRDPLLVRQLDLI